MVGDNVCDFLPTFCDVFVLCCHRHADADPTTGWEFAAALANFIGALRRMIVTDRNSQLSSFLFRQYHVILALQNAQQSDPQLFHFSPVGFVLWLLQHIFDALGQRDSLV